MSLFSRGDLDTLADTVIPSLERQHISVILCKVDLFLAIVVVDSRDRFSACYCGDHSVAGTIFGAAQRVTLSIGSSALFGRPFEVGICRSTAGSVGKEFREYTLDQRPESSERGS
jgi:hypothetical protein